MKIAVLSDVHANLPALRAVAEDIDAWRPDQVILAGDLVNRGPRSADCLAFAQQRQAAQGWLILLGNHEQYVMRHAEPGAPREGPEFDLRRGSYFTFCQLNRDVTALAAWPYHLDLTPSESGCVRITHASMRGTRDGIYGRTSDYELREQIGTPPPVLFCAGHTHLPLVRQLGCTLVVNAGSVGLPFDSDTRAGYAQLTWRGGQWTARIVRLVYDIAQADRDYDETGFIDEGGPLARLMRIELRTGRSQLYQWARRYEAPVLAGLMTMEESVEQFLES